MINEVNDAKQIVLKALQFLFDKNYESSLELYELTKDISPDQVPPKRDNAFETIVFFDRDTLSFDEGWLLYFNDRRYVEEKNSMFSLEGLTYMVITKEGDAYTIETRITDETLIIVNNKLNKTLDLKKISYKKK